MRISVFKRSKFSVQSSAFALLASFAHAADVELAWNPSPSPNVVGYTIKQGTNSRAYTVFADVGLNLTGWRPLLPGSNYFAVTARGAFGTESDPSNEIAVWGRPVAPAGPTNAINRSLARTWTIPAGAMLQRSFDLDKWSEHIRNTGASAATVRVSEDGHGRLAFYRLWTNAPVAAPPLPGAGRAR